MQLQVPATKFKSRPGKYLKTAETTPVIVKGSGQRKSVLISYDLFQKFQACEDYCAALKGRQSENEGPEVIRQLEKITSDYRAITDEAELSVFDIYKERQQGNERTLMFD